eukprot:CAMPEP_0179231532 /NCGR_PEP_ID=MMETSP0797-20121207/11391_1 /TAXON_ID=47934 /ORGANISM="Dinophysis acuminata, Strain DAEP01" /LENGTH=626 /DNA_ID=CAMNT_0020938621 /DNA_START=130 /DNA_END=2010 /DNA_ORIENTATION=-
MEFVAVSKDGVHIYEYAPGESVPSEAVYTFPPVPTAEGCVWSADGRLLGLVDTATGGVSIYSVAGGYVKQATVLPLIGGPVRTFYFSPLGSCLVTFERYVKEENQKSDNVGIWNAKTGELKWSFTLKKMTGMNWPPVKWTYLETHCCRMVNDGVVVLNGKADPEPLGKVEVPGVMAFEVAPQGSAGTGPVHVAVVTPESKGAPGRCQIFRIDDPSRPTASKSFYKVQSADLQWNNTGTGLLITTRTESDDTGESYYGNANLYFIRYDGQEDCIVASSQDGTVHDVQWNPIADEFLLLHGKFPCELGLYEGKKGNKRAEFGKAHRNNIKWNPFGRFACVGGWGQLKGDTDFWDKSGKKLMGTTCVDCCVFCGWAPDGRHFLTATTHPRMRVDNKIVVYDYCGQDVGRMQFDELLWAGWRPRPRGTFQDKPPSPRALQEASAPKQKAAADPKKQAYRPPAARGTGGLAELLRSELGSTSADTKATATKMLPPGASGYSLPPGASPSDSAGPGNSRNARKKNAKKKAEAAAEEEPPAADDSKSAADSGGYPKPPPKEAEPALAPATSGAGSDAEMNPEIEKKVKALKKKLRDIEKLKEKPAAELDVLQKNKIKAEADLVAQIRALGGEV